jgi:cell division protein FtsB
VWLWGGGCNVQSEAAEVEQLQRQLDGERARNGEFAAQQQRTASEFTQLKETCDWLVAQLREKLGAAEGEADGAA